MKVSDLIKQLKGCEDFTLLVSSDEELNTLFKRWQIAKLTGRPKTLVIYGLSSSKER